MFEDPDAVTEWIMASSNNYEEFDWKVSDDRTMFEYKDEQGTAIITWFTADEEFSWTFDYPNHSEELNLVGYLSPMWEEASRPD